MSQQVVTPTGDITPEAECERDLVGQIGKALHINSDIDHRPWSEIKLAAFHAEASLRAQLAAAEAALERAGYVRCAGPAAWKPPLGPSASPLLEKIDNMEACLATATKALEEIASLYEARWRIKGIAGDALRSLTNGAK